MKNILFDSEIFALQQFGGASKYFSEIIREFIEHPELGISPHLTFKRTNNYYLKNLSSNLKSKLREQRPFYLAQTSPLRTLITLGPIRQLMLNLSCGVDFSERRGNLIHATYYRPTLMERLGSSAKAVTIHDLIPERLGWSNVRNPHIGKKKFL